MTFNICRWSGVGLQKEVHCRSYKKLFIFSPPQLHSSLISEILYVFMIGLWFMVEVSFFFWWRKPEYPEKTTDIVLVLNMHELFGTGRKVNNQLVNIKELTFRLHFFCEHTDVKIWTNMISYYFARKYLKIKIPDCFISLLPCLLLLWQRYLTPVI